MDNQIAFELIGIQLNESNDESIDKLVIISLNWIIQAVIS